MKAIATKSLGIDDELGLEKQVSVFTILIDAENEKIDVGYVIEILSPKGIVVSKSTKMYYTRRNNVEQRDPEGKLITEANMKFDTLRVSQIGKAIEEMIASDLDEYPDF